MKIIVTGAAGFIGFHLCKNLLKNKKITVIGIDNINSYYSKSIKKKRILLLKKNNFIFKKIDLINKKKLDLVIKKFNPETIYHLAGQPGVLYSFKNPNSYKINNITATKVLCKISKKYKIKNFIFGSSSSVYGDHKKFPIKENFKKKPKNYYAITKYKCEKIVEKNFKLSPVNYKIFRFFTVYGPYGRPDMFIHKFLNALKKNKQINIHNKGKNLRDFTYIDDVVKILANFSIISNKIKILNIARSKPVKNIDLINEIKKIYRQKKENFNFIKTVKGEMLKTHGCNKKLINNFKKFKFTKLNEGLVKTIKIFKKYGI